jgi:fermentation-respiration switch protein FrsA (DUF1100 family)
VFHPLKEWKTTPDAQGLAYEDLTVTALDGTHLSAWYIPASQAKGSVLFFHGNSRNMSSDFDAILLFHRAGLNVLTIDYRGYGKSEGSPTEEGTYLDAEAAWIWLTTVKGERPGRIVISGRSLGAAIAADLASKHAPAGLILEAAFTSLPDAAAAVYPYFPVRLLSHYRYDTLSKLPKIKCPVLIVHSRQDELIPFSQGERLYRAVSGAKTFVELGGPHKGGYQPTIARYEAGVERFLKELALS